MIDYVYSDGFSKYFKSTTKKHPETSKLFVQVGEFLIHNFNWKSAKASCKGEKPRYSLSLNNDKVSRRPFIIIIPYTEYVQIRICHDYKDKKRLKKILPENFKIKKRRDANANDTYSIEYKITKQVELDNFLGLDIINYFSPIKANDKKIEIDKKSSKNSVVLKATRKSIEETNVFLNENSQLRPIFRKWLKENIPCFIEPEFEVETSNGGRIDVLFTTKQLIPTICELKWISTDETSEMRWKTRTGIGQLLEYSYFSSKMIDNVTELWLVLNKRPEPEIVNFMKSLKDERNIRISCYVLKNNSFKNIL